MVITGHVSCGHNYFLNYPASSLALLSDQLYYMVTCGLEMLQKLTWDQVCVHVCMRQCVHASVRACVCDAKCFCSVTFLKDIQR